MPLVSTIATVQKHVSVSMASDIDTLLPDIEFVEEEYLKPVLGEAQYNDLLDNISAPSPTQQKLIDKCAPAICNMAYAIYSEIGQLDISDAGFRINTDDGKKTAFQWQIEAVTNNYFFKKGYRQIDWMLNFLEGNESDYPLWVADTTAYTRNRKYLVNTTDEFNEIYDIKSSRRVFLKMWPILQKVEDFEVKPAIGADQYNELKTQIKEKTLTEDNEALLKLLQPAVVHHAVHRGATELSTEFSYLGITVTELESEATTRKTTKASDSERGEKKTQALKDARAYLQNAVDYLNGNASKTKYPLYFNSDKFVDLTQTDGDYYFKNDDPDSSLFGAF